MLWKPYDTPSTYSANSLMRLKTCSEPIQKIFLSLAQDGWDISIFCGRRTEEEQTAAYAAGLSNARWPYSDHNVEHPDDLSDAIDAGPWVSGIGVPWKAGDAVWTYFAGVTMSKAHELGHELEWGGFYVNKKTGRPLKDMNHFSLVK